MLGGVPVPNQAPPLIDYNLFETDLVLCEGLRRECASWAEPVVSNFGRLMGLDVTDPKKFCCKQAKVSVGELRLVK